MSGKAIRESLGFLAVVASMVFVGWEIRQNTTATKAAAIQAMSAQTAEYLTAWTTDEYIPDLLLRASEGGLPEDFTASENQRMLLAYVTALRAYESRVLQVQLGILDEDMFEVMAGSGDFYRRPWLKAAWGPRIESTLSSEFAAFFKERFAIESED